MTDPFLLLMPSYNQARFIGEAVESVLQQDDPGWELWILDNSSDGTSAAMSRYSDPRIHFIHDDTRMDPGTCLNRLLALAKGDHFSYIHTDNRLLPSYVRENRKALECHPLSVAVCDYWEISEEGHRLKIRRRPDPFPLRRLFSVDTIGVPFSATTQLARNLGGFSASDLADDVLFVLRADPHGPRIHIAGPQMEYRVHSSSRFLQSGTERVHQAVHRSVLQAYLERPAHLADPFSGAERRIRKHVDRASRMAIILAKALLSGVEKSSPIWIEGRGPASFWLAWACQELGYSISGFKGSGEFLGLPCAQNPPLGAVCLKPRTHGASAVHRGLRWLMSGLPPLDHTLKRLPGDILAALLIPYQAQSPEAKCIAIRGSGPMAAYLAFGAEVLAGLRVCTLEGCCPWGWMPRENLASDAVWVALGESGEGLRWDLKGSRLHSEAPRHDQAKD